MNFEPIIGNSEIKQLLIKSFNSNSYPHSYMFIGIDGIGKSLFAKEFAKLILDANSLTNHPDFMAVLPEDSKSIKIEQIRYLQEKIAEKPIMSDKKVYIIENSDTMTTEAQNCLLKTLEEPPKYAIIILILSNENSMLPTIKSRCTKITFKPLKDEEILQYFSDNNLERPSSNLLKVCGGSIGKAINLQNETELYEKIDDLIDGIDQKDIIEVWGNSEYIYKSKENINHLLEYMNIVFVQKFKDSNDMRYINCIKYIENAKKRLSSNSNYDMSIDSLLLKIWEEFNEKYSWS